MVATEDSGQEWTQGLQLWQVGGVTYKRELMGLRYWLQPVLEAKNQ